MDYPQHCTPLASGRRVAPRFGTVNLLRRPMQECLRRLHRAKTSMKMLERGLNRSCASRIFKVCYRRCTPNLKSAPVIYGPILERAVHKAALIFCKNSCQSLFSTHHPEMNLWRFPSTVTKISLFLISNSLRDENLYVFLEGPSSA